jgi:hypothetical protein
VDAGNSSCFLGEHLALQQSLLYRPLGRRARPAQSLAHLALLSTYHARQLDRFRTETSRHRPIDVSSREKEVEERIEQERAARATAAAAKEKDIGRFGPTRGSKNEFNPSSPRMAASRLERTPNSPKLAGSGLQHTPASPEVTDSSIEYAPASPNLEHGPGSPKIVSAEGPAAQAPRKEFPTSHGAVRPKLSFAAAASGRQGSGTTGAAGNGPATVPGDDEVPTLSDAGVDKITEQVAEVLI